MAQNESAVAQKPKATGLKAFNQFITGTSTQQYLLEVLNDKKSSFVNNLVALVANNSALQQCEPSSTMFCALKATALDLPIDANLGFCYVIPYRDNKNGRTVSTFQLGKNGLIQLALRSGQVTKLNVRDVREGELVGEDFISGDLEFKKLEGDRTRVTIIGFVAYLKLANGFEKMLYMTKEEIDAHARRFSQSFRGGYGVWKDHYESMAEKTMLKRILSKYAPLSTEMQQAFAADHGVITDKGVEFIDNYSDIEQEQADLAASIFENAIEVKAEEVKEETNSEMFPPEDKGKSKK